MNSNARRFFYAPVGGAFCLLMAMVMMSAGKADDGVMTKEKGVYVVNTTSLSKKVTGYVGATPVKIFIEKDRVIRIEALPNEESPKQNAQAKKVILQKWNGMKVKDAAKMKVDAVTGATFTSNAYIRNVQLGLEYYRKHKNH